MLEALIAVVILALGLLGVVGLQARSYAAVSDAGLRAEATLAADQLLGIMNNNKAPVVLQTFEVGPDDEPPAPMQEWAKATRDRIPGAKFEVIVTPGARTTQIDLDIRWTRRKNDAENHHQVRSYIMQQGESL